MKFRGGSLSRLLPVMLIFISFIIGQFSCSYKQGKSERLHIAVVNKKDAAGKAMPITVTIVIDGAETVQKQVIKGDQPFSLIKALKEGNHTIEIREGITDSNYKTSIFMNHEKWLRVVFYREGKGMGYFDGKTQDRPFGYEFEKPDGDEKDKDKVIKDRESYEEDYDKRLEELGKETRKKNKEKTMSKKTK